MIKRIVCFRGFLFFLALVIIAIFWRTIYVRTPVTYTVITVSTLTESNYSELKTALLMVEGVRKDEPMYSEGQLKITFRTDLLSRYDLADVIDDTGHKAILKKAGESLDVLNYRIYMN